MNNTICFLSMCILALIVSVHACDSQDLPEIAKKQKLQATIEANTLLHLPEELQKHCLSFLAHDSSARKAFQSLGACLATCTHWKKFDQDTVFMQAFCKTAAQKHNQHWYTILCNNFKFRNAYTFNFDLIENPLFYDRWQVVVRKKWIDEQEKKIKSLFDGKRNLVELGYIIPLNTGIYISGSIYAKWKYGPPSNLLYLLCSFIVKINNNDEFDTTFAQKSPRRDYDEEFMRHAGAFLYGLKIRSIETKIEREGETRLEFTTNENESRQYGCYSSYSHPRTHRIRVHQLSLDGNSCYDMGYESNNSY